MRIYWESHLLKGWEDVKSQVRVFWLHGKNAQENKRKILEIVKNGGDRPSKKTPLGIALIGYINKSSTSYDPEFDREFRAYWRPKRVNKAQETKELLLSMAFAGEDRPKKNTKLYDALKRYTYKGSTSYDAEFEAKIRPIWPLDFGEAKNIRQMLMDMAANHEPKPAGRKNKLAQALSRYIYKSSTSYNEEFCQFVSRYWKIKGFPAPTEPRSGLIRNTPPSGTDDAKSNPQIPD